MSKFSHSSVIDAESALGVADGPYNFEQDIAARLAESGSKGTFFLNGNSKSHLPYTR